MTNAKTKKDAEWQHLLLLCSFSACPHSHAYLHSLWFYMTAGMKIQGHLLYKLAQGSYVFSSQKNKSCTQSICADICAEVSGDFHYIMCFHLNDFPILPAILSKSWSSLELHTTVNSCYPKLSLPRVCYVHNCQIITFLICYFCQLLYLILILDLVVIASITCVIIKL